MKLNLTSDELAELAKLIAAKDENILASSLLLSFLLDAPHLINTKDIQRMNKRGLVGEDAYAKALALKLSEGKSDIAELLHRHMDVKCLSSVKHEYVDNKYYLDLMASKRKVGAWSLDEGTYTPYEAFAWTDIEVKNPYYLEKTRLGYLTDTFSFPVILEDKDVWMSITPHEIETMRKAIKKVTGNVVVMGLGLGYFPYMASLKKEVKTITIIEKDEDAIALFKEHLLPLFPFKDKIVIVAEDALEYAKHVLPNVNTDYCFVDLYHSVDDGLVHFLEMKKLEPLAKKTEFIYWLEDSMFAMVRRIIITLFQEALEGFEAKDYQKSKTSEDRIFNDLYRRLTDYSFSSFREIQALLEEKALNELLKK